MNQLKEAEKKASLLVQESRKGSLQFFITVTTLTCGTMEFVESTSLNVSDSSHYDFFHIAI